ncbi:GH32 C-terminal domain-containing protein [Paenibacillus sp. 2TAB23]|uniref:GH32 C-terminal domain-containing protein n=1 Tax=Paenibacillus sp. 2TAB23 TaxID=3233004 RepID=UPI003F99C3B7
MQYSNQRNRSFIASWSFDEGSGNLTRDAASSKEDKIENALEKGRFGPPQHPVWHQGISGTALSFDGYSTYIRRSSADVEKPTDGLTITAWIAPRTYDLDNEHRLCAIVNQHNREQAQGYLFGLYQHGSWSLQLGIDNEWVEVWCHDKPIPKNRWSFVVAVYDKGNGMLKLYLNGEEAASHKASVTANISPCETDLLIGRHNEEVVLAEPFIKNHFDGLMDEVQIHSRSLSGEEICEIFREALEPYGGKLPEISIQDLMIPRERFKQDRHRPQFHLNPPGHWMNEPHAPIYFNGRYHLFYQANPRGPFWGAIHWGHWVSEDLVRWRDLPSALAPEPGIDSDGIWSGSAALDENGIPALFYTAGNLTRYPDQCVALARSTFLEDGDPELIRWKKRQIPLVTQPTDDGVLPGMFRDPFVWKEDGRWIMLVGGGIVERGGTAFVYVSENLETWDYKGEFFLSDYTKYPHLGTGWELPVLLPLKRDGQETGKHIFVFSPWGVGAKMVVHYWIGTYDNENLRFIPDSEDPQQLDVDDYHFSGPSGMVDPVTGRSLLFTIAQGERTHELEYDSGWAHDAGMPVSLSLREDGRLGVEPICEMEQLRDSLLLQLSDVSMEEANRRLQDIHGTMLEIDISFNAGHANRYGVSVRRSLEGEEETKLYYDKFNKKLGVDRSRATLDSNERTTGIQEGELDLRGEALSLRVFVDRSLIETYANGLKSLTTRTYPSRIDADGIRLFSDEDIQIKSLRIWSMKPVFHDQ